MRPALTLALGGLAFVSAAPAWAQDGLIIDRNRLDRRPDAPAPDATPETPVTATRAPLRSFVLRAVAVEGPPDGAAAVQAAVAPFIGETLDAAGVRRLYAAVSGAYAGSRTALPVISLDMSRAAEGVVRATILPGAVERVSITGDVEGDLALLRAYAERLTTERPLSRARAERYLSLINDIPGVDAKVRTARGSGPGALNLGVEIDRDRWAYDFGFDNRASESLGGTQFSVGASLYGAFRMGDQTRLALSTGEDVETFQYLSLAHRQPIGTDGMSATVSVGRLRTRLPTREGDATTASAVVSWPMIRSYRRNLILSAGLDGLNSNNALLGNLFTTERTRTLRASAAFSRVWPRGNVVASLTASQGIDALGARPDLLGQPDFLKFNGRLDLARAIGRQFRLSGTAAIQHTDSRLPTSELFTLGGSEFGRGFPSALLVGDKAIGYRAEAAWRPTFMPQPVRGTEFYVFGDGGEATLNPRPGFAGRDDSLSSAGIGTRIAIRSKIVVELEAAKAIDDPRGGDGDWRFGWGLSGRF
jgi:hemolysin activation/secretion protein